MRTEVRQLLKFYQTDAGQAVAKLLGADIGKLWPDIDMAPILGLGYITPLVAEAKRPEFRHFMAMQGSQGVVVPSQGEPLSLLAEDDCLPFSDSTFDRVLVCHWLEFVSDHSKALAEIWRVLAPGGRALFVVTNRLGFWSWRESTPFARGTPYTQMQLLRELRSHRLEPGQVKQALHLPPFDRLYRSSQSARLERACRFLPGGVHMIEAEKVVFAPVKAEVVRPRLHRPLIVQTPAQQGRSMTSRLEIESVAAKWAKDKAASN